MKLYMVVLGCKPAGRLTEQHDVFFGIGASLSSLIPQMNQFWPEAKGEIHIDSWREVTSVDGYAIEIVSKQKFAKSQPNLYFINLGGYKKNDLEEYHYKILTVGKTLAQATKKSKATAFYNHYNFRGAESHLDDKYGVDVDDIYKVEEILPPSLKSEYSLKIIMAQAELLDDKLNVGYLGLSKLSKMNK